jgi:4-amino-4-deoxy-L-arabinose transferase-like glycosyltransferase
MGIINRRDVLTFILVLAALLVRHFLSPPIWHHGEAREALVVRGIVHHQEWILPLRNSELPSKPPLFHWLAALPALLVGLNDFTVRLPSVIGAEVMAIATFLLGRAAGGRKIGWLSVGALLGMAGFWNSAAQARVDMVFSACITVAIVGFFFWFRDGHKGARATCYIATTCAVLAKGPAGIVLIGLVIVSFLFTERRLRLLWSFWSWPLVVFLLFMDFGWYVLAYQLGGKDFLEGQLLRENVDRALGTGEFTLYESPLVVVGWFASRIFPWNLAILWSLIRRLRGTREDAAGHLLHAWWISILLAFAFAAGKRAVYLLPLFPAIAVLAARAIADMSARWVPASATPASSRDSAPRLPSRSPVAAISAGIVVFDMVVLFMSSGVWRSVESWKPRLSVVEQIGATVPPDAALFATPEMENFQLIAIAYRLGREIERKTLMCAGKNDYFLSPIDSGALLGVEKQLYLSSGDEYIFLLKMDSGIAAHDDPECSRKSAEPSPR